MQGLALVLHPQKGRLYGMYTSFFVSFLFHTDLAGGCCCKLRVLLRASRCGKEL
jgi:hypothetical protein